MPDNTPLYSRLRREFPFQAVMLADHPDDPRFRAGHWFCFARRAGAHLQVLHQSSRCRVLIPRTLLDEVAPFEADDPPPPAPAAPAAPAAERLAAYLRLHGGPRP